MSELIVSEIGFLSGGDVDFAVFVEVALVEVAREIIMLPVENRHLELQQIGMWVDAAALLGLTYLFVRMGQRRAGRFSKQA